MEKRNRLKQVGALLACLCILFSMLSVCVQGAAVYTRPQKHVYLVMDDSGSMDDKELDANYALQTLVAMMDKTDTISLYFLNAGENVYGKLDLLQKSNAMLDNIKVNYPESDDNTPYTVVSTAQSDLKMEVEADATDEYWLVVITDGDFNYPKMNYEKDLLKFASTPLKNGRLPKVMCIGINSDSVIRPENATADNVYTQDGYNIISSMNEAAAAISGRIIVDDKSVSSNGTKLSFNVPYPARNIIVFTQNTQTTISSYTSASKLNTNELYTVARPIPTNDLDKSTVCFITESSGASIAPGEVTFTFSKAINQSNTVVLIEPAIGLAAHFYNQDGKECDPSQLKVGEKAKLVYKICDPSTQQEIDEAVIAGGVKYSADINGNHYDSNEIDFTVDKDILELDMYAEFTDGFTLDIHDKYEDLFENRIISLNLSTATYSADINSKDKNNFITASPSYNGIKFVDDEFKACTLEIKGDENPFKLRVEVEADPATGTYTISPKKGLLGVFTPLQQELELTFKTDKGEIVTEGISIELTGTRNWIGFIISILLIAFLVYCFIVYVFFKPKFPLDLRLRCYYNRGEGVNVTHPEIKKTLFSPGVINFKSALPIPGPFQINAGKVFGMGNLVIEPQRKSKKKNYRANVKNVTETEVPVRRGFTRRPNNNKVETKIDFIIQDIELYSERGFPGEDKILEFENGEYIREELHHATNGPQKYLRYIRKRTLKQRGEL